MADGRADNRLVKQLEKSKKHLEEGLKGQYQTERDNTLNFEDLGIDQMFIDEADEFKNLGVITKMSNIAGISTTRSQKAFDLFVKIQYIYQKNNGRGVEFLTGTPISYIQNQIIFKVSRKAFKTWQSHCSF